MTITIDIELLSDVLGASIRGVDLSKPVDAATQKILCDLFIEHLVLCFPGQQLTASDQLRFANIFGRGDGGDRAKSRDSNNRRTGERGMMLVSNIRKNGKFIGVLPNGEMMFHSDGAYAKRPFRYTLLYAIEVPSFGGNTKFSNMYKAYDALPEDFKKRLSNCHAEQVYYAGSVQKDKPSESLTGSRIHPLFIKHEETGRTALYASRLITTRIDELSKGESDEV